MAKNFVKIYKYMIKPVVEISFRLLDIIFFHSRIPPIFSVSISPEFLKSFYLDNSPFLTSLTSLSSLLLKSAK